MEPIQSIFSPRSIAVVGVTENPDRLGHLLFKNILDYGFDGAVYPFCATGGEVLGRKAMTRLSELQAEVDLVLLTVPLAEAGDALRDCARLKPRAVVLLSSGFGETGPEARRLDKAIQSLAAGGTRVMGPNCRGLFDANRRLNATLYRDVPRTRGNIAFVTQSGSYGGLLFDQVRLRGLGLSRFASVGNQMDLDSTDFLEAMGEDDHTDVIGLFVEEVRDGARFVQVAAELSMKKPVVVFKAGRTVTGGRAAQAHTGSDPGNLAVFEAAARQAGLLLAHDTDHFFDMITALSCYARQLPASDAVAIAGVSGGPAVTAADVCEQSGLRLAALEPATRKAIGALLPQSGTAQNPVDLTPEIDPQNLAACADLVLGDKGVAALIALNVGMDRPEFAQAFVAARDKHAKPVLAFAAAAPGVTAALTRAGICVYPTPERAVQACQALVSYRRMLEIQKRKGIMPRVAPAAAVPGSAAERRSAPRPSVSLDGADSLARLRAAGLPTALLAVLEQPKEVGPATAHAPWPVTLHLPGRGKIPAIQIEGLTTRKQVARAYATMKRKAGKTPILLLRSVEPSLSTLCVEGWRDPVFGCVLRIGLSGAFSELLRDQAVRVCPIRRTDAEAMLQELRGWPLLARAWEGAQGGAAAVAELLVKFSDLLLAQADLQEVKLDPVVLIGGEAIVEAAHARVLRPS